jgi:hypothetical protein
MTINLEARAKEVFGPWGFLTHPEWYINNLEHVSKIMAVGECAIKEVYCIAEKLGYTFLNKRTCADLGHVADTIEHSMLEVLKTVENAAVVVGSEAIKVLSQEELGQEQ